MSVQQVKSALEIFISEPDSRAVVLKGRVGHWENTPLEYVAKTEKRVNIPKKNTLMFRFSN